MFLINFIFELIDFTFFCDRSLYDIYMHVFQAPPGVAKPQRLGNSPSLSSSPVPPPGVVAPVPVPPVSVVVPQLGSGGIVTATTLGMVMPTAIEGVPKMVPPAVVAPAVMGVAPVPVPVPTTLPGK